MTPEYCC